MKHDERQLSITKAFIKEHRLAVLATVNADFLPEAAVVGFSVNEHLHLNFGTFRTSRKYQNLQKNPRVALVIGWEKGKTVQYEGVARELEGKEREEAIKEHLKTAPSAAKYVSDPDEAYFEVKPLYVKYSDLSSDPWETFEFRFLD